MRHSPHYAGLWRPPVPDLGTPVQPTLDQRVSKRKMPLFESGHHCPIMPCAGPSIRPNTPSRAAQKSRQARAKGGEPALQAAASSSGLRVSLRPIALGVRVDTPPLACGCERDNRTRSAMITKGGDGVTSGQGGAKCVRTKITPAAYWVADCGARWSVHFLRPHFSLPLVRFRSEEAFLSNSPG